MAASPIATTTTLGTYLGTNSYSAAQLTQAVGWANDAVEKYTGRIFADAARRDWQYLQNTDQLVLQHRPVTVFYRVCAGVRDCLGVSYTSSTSGAMAQVGLTDTNLGISYGAPVLVDELLLATYSTLALLEAAIEAIDSWFEATVYYECAPNDLRPVVATDCLNTIAYLEGPDDPIGIAEVDAGAGVIRLDSKRTGWVFAQYNAGYTTYPAELEQIATEMAAAILRTDPSVSIEKVGNTQFTYAGAGDVISAFYPRLNKFRDLSLL